MDEVPMDEVHVAEARALGPSHCADTPGGDELALSDHDASWSAMIVVACGLTVAAAALLRRSSSSG